MANLLERCLAHVQNPMTLPLPAELRRWGPRKRRPLVRAFAWGETALTAIAVLASAAGFFGSGDDDVRDAGARERVAAAAAISAKEPSAPGNIPEEDLERMQRRIESIRNDWSDPGDPHSPDWTERIEELRSRAERLQREMRDERI